MKIGDKLKFKKFHWEIISNKKNYYGIYEYKYRVIRKYLKGILKLSYTKCTYDIRCNRWNFLKTKLKENPNYHYNMSLWSNVER